MKSSLVLSCGKILSNLIQSISIQVKFSSMKSSLVLFCGKIQCPDPASIHRYSACTAWTALLFSCDCTALRCICAVFTLYLHCILHHICLQCIWTALLFCCGFITLHCAVLSGWTSVQSLAFHRVIVSGQCPGSPWPRTPFAFKKKIEIDSHMKMDINQRGF